MDNENKKQPKKKSGGSGLVGVIIVLVIWLLRRVDLSTLTARLRWMLRTGNFHIDSSAVFGILAVVVVLLGIAAVVRVAKTAAGKSGSSDVPTRRSPAVHSHDRISGYTVGSCSDLEHWKRQLDGFLEAGIIDRAEYRVLLERRKTISSDK